MVDQGSAAEPLPPAGAAIQFVNAQQTMQVIGLWDINEREWAKIMADERDVCRKPRNTLVDIFKGLKLRQMNHNEKRLLKWVFNRFGLFKNFYELRFDKLWDFERMKNRA